MKPLYILGRASISPQGFQETERLPEVPRTYNEIALTAVEPDYKSVAGPVELRRMNRSMKMGLWCARKALNQANAEKPDIIITGTGLGCLQDTVSFLKVMLDSDESQSAPALFISSTHNSVGGQLALRFKCTGYNYTYCHKSLSLYSALLDASLHLDDNPKILVLAGCLDEHVEEKFRHYSLRGWWRKQSVSNLELFRNAEEGTISGEGCQYFVLSRSIPSTVAITGMDGAEFADSEQIHQRTQSLLEGLKPHNTLVLTGLSGDAPTDTTYYELRNQCLKGFPVGAFRHLCGTYHTSDGYAVWLAAQILDQGFVPSYVLAFSSEPPVMPRHVVIYSHLRGAGHVWYRLSRI